MDSLCGMPQILCFGMGDFDYVIASMPNCDLNI